MTIFGLRIFVFRACGSGKLCADSKSGVPRVFPPTMNLSWSKVLAHLERLSAPFFGPSPDRFA